MPVYEGKKTENGAVVTVDGKPLCPRLDLASHSVDGFAWGYTGNRSAQLALAILAHHCGSNEMRALRNYEIFKERVIALLDHSGWRLDSEKVEFYLTAIEV